MTRLRWHCVRAADCHQFNVLRTDRRAVESSDGRLPCKRGFCRFTEVLQAQNCRKSCPRMHAKSALTGLPGGSRESLGAPWGGPGGPVGAPRAKNGSKMVPMTQLGPKLGPTWADLGPTWGQLGCPGQPRTAPETAWERSWTLPGSPGTLVWTGPRGFGSDF